MFNRSAFFSFSKNLFREFHKARCRIQRRQDKINAYLSSADHLLSKPTTPDAALLGEVAQTVQFLQSNCSPSQNSPSKPIVKRAESNQFSRNYTQTYSAATKRNGGVRGSTASKWK